MSIPVPVDFPDQESAEDRFGTSRGRKHPVREIAKGGCQNDSKEPQNAGNAEKLKQGNFPSDLRVQVRFRPGSWLHAVYIVYPLKPRPQER